MNNNHLAIVSKVLVLDENSDWLRSFCEKVNLSGIRPNRPGAEGVMGVLRSNVDLGGILLWEGFLNSAEATLELAERIRFMRPELPIFFRASSNKAWFQQKGGSTFRYVYTLETLDELEAILSSHIFSRIYPNAVARGIREISLNSLNSIFAYFDIDAEPPYLVFDRIIHGEVFTLIAIDTDWCRGYMTWQGAEGDLNALASMQHPEHDFSFREVIQYLGELTNLVWGGFKNNFGVSEASYIRTQVPIIINTKQRFISFGSEDPQLCFKFTLTPKNKSFPPISLYQRFIFNLSWRPEDFRENATVESLVASGDLEMF